MYTYTWWQWLLFFYFYSFAGWVWESIYVSCKQKRFVNRGFLHLPLLPLYGSGAVVVLFAALPFRDHVVLLYLVGMAAATCLELMTGLTMEAVYKVKYWDYSSKRFNYRGVICLQASLLWGVFSVVMVRAAHVPVAHLLLQIPNQIIYPVLAIVSAGFVCDFYESNRKAIQLAHVLTAMEKAREEMRENLRHAEEELEEQRHILEERLTDAREHAEAEIVERIEEAILQTDEMRERNREVRRRMADSAEFIVGESRRRVIHTIEGARLNMLFHNEELLRGMERSYQEYQERQEARLLRAETLSRSMLLRNPTARTLVGHDVNHWLRRGALQWLEDKKKNTVE